MNNIIAPSLSKLINASINDEKYPHCLKISKMVPIFKSGNKEECTNYRPITLLSSFNKIFGKKIQSDLINHIERNQLLYEKQFGFRKYHSTIDALINTYDYIIEQLRNRHVQ